jgi:hypothetical protein
MPKRGRKGAGHVGKNETGRLGKYEGKQGNLPRKSRKLKIAFHAKGDLKSRAKGRSKEKAPFKSLSKGRRKR